METSESPPTTCSNANVESTGDSEGPGTSRVSKDCHRVVLATRAKRSNANMAIIYDKFMTRRAGVSKALTVEFEKFFLACDSEKELSLHGLENGGWRLVPPVPEVPNDLPEPSIGINYVRDEMTKREWLELVARHSDAWLFALLSYWSVILTKEQRQKLFEDVCELPPVVEVVENYKPHLLQVPEGVKQGMVTSPLQPDIFQKDMLVENEPVEDDDSLCGLCHGECITGKRMTFWIWCDCCKHWYHGHCVGVTRAKAKKIGLYECPICCSIRETATDEVTCVIRGMKITKNSDDS